MSDQNTLPITVISAGAGSGKTYSLTQRMVEMLRKGMRPAGIIATTFTKKAAAELQERVRVKLLEEGLTDAANELGEALIGTVHSVGTRLLQRFAFEAGVSPLVEIIAEEDSDRMFNESLAQALSEARIDQLNALADRLGLSKKRNDGDAYDWRRDIHTITDIARANNFSAEVLAYSKVKSWETFAEFLPTPQATDSLTWKNRLQAQLEQTIAATENNTADTTKTTKDALAVLKNFETQLRYRGELHWYEWVKISKTNPGKKSQECFADLLDFANQHLQHTDFQQDIRNFIELIFDISTDALHEFEQYKKKRGLIDYTDMEAQVSLLIRNPQVRATLQSEIDLLLVDEFQDTSPIQLDIFLQLSRLAKHSIWVGDPKQSIYGFRGAEPALMFAIIEKTGGVLPENILSKSWRSREDIVQAVNAVFVKAFPGMPTDQVVLAPVRCRNNEVDAQPLALMHWHFRSELEEKRPPGDPWMQLCIATQIGVLLERKLPVLPKGEKTCRPVQPGDIAVLCRSNTACEKMADALHQVGLKAAIARTGLLSTREATLVVACLKFLLNPADALSMSEIRLLASGESLEQIIGDRIAFLEKKREQVQHEFWSADNAFLKKLLEIRQRIHDLSASEIMGLLFDELDLRRVVVALGNAPQRLDNLDMLRKYAYDYEDACTRLHSAASLGGFLLWLSNLQKSGKDPQGSGENPDAVRVMTYHKSKGLEFPVTICHGLTADLRERVWGVNLVQASPEIDLDNILANRWLRFWVNPYADLAKNTPLLQAIEQSEVYAQARLAALEEDARLLYVGLTRARDYLIFPTNRRPTAWLNRVFNQGDPDVPTLDPYSEETPFYVNGQVLHIATELIYQPKDFATVQPAAQPFDFHEPARGAKLHSNYKIDLQQLPPNYPPCGHPNIHEPIRFGDNLEIEQEYFASLHQALRSVMLADYLDQNMAQRTALAARQLAIRLVPESAFAPERGAHQSKLFLSFLAKEIVQTAAKWHRAVPVEMIFQEKLLELTVDFLIEKPHEIIAVQILPPADLKKNVKTVLERMYPQMAWIHLYLTEKFHGKSVALWGVSPALGVVAQYEVV